MSARDGRSSLRVRWMGDSGNDAPKYRARRRNRQFWALPSTRQSDAWMDQRSLKNSLVYSKDELWSCLRRAERAGAFLHVSRPAMRSNMPARQIGGHVPSTAVLLRRATWSRGFSGVSRETPASQHDPLEFLAMALTVESCTQCSLPTPNGEISDE